MKTIQSILAVGVLSLGLLHASTAVAQAQKTEKEKPAANASASSGKLMKLTEKDTAWAAKAREAYPLKVCVTSDEKLGSMGENAEYVYREKGKPDRLVMFCCEGCEEDFMKEPAKYLAKIDAAAKEKAAVR